MKKLHFFFHQQIVPFCPCVHFEILKPLFVLALLLFSRREQAQNMPVDTEKIITESIIHKNILFNTGKFELVEKSLLELDTLVKSLDKSKNIEIEMSGYTDNRGKKENNILLSENRAKTVFDYFAMKGVDPKHMHYQGYGVAKQNPDNSTEASRKENRRVEIVVKLTVSTIHVVRQQPLIAAKSITDLEVGKTMVLQNLNFKGGTAILLPEAKPALEELVKTMNDNPTFEIEIGGHVCCYDDMPLSVLRAQSVYNYLIRNGIAASRMTYKGYSRNKPIFEDDRDAEKAQANRRVEITVLKK